MENAHQRVKSRTDVVMFHLNVCPFSPVEIKPPSTEAKRMVGQVSKALCSLALLKHKLPFR